MSVTLWAVVGYLVVALVGLRPGAKLLYRHGERQWPSLYRTPEGRLREARSSAAFAVVFALLWPWVVALYCVVCLIGPRVAPALARVTGLEREARRHD